MNYPLYCRKCQVEQTAILRYGSLENMQKLNLLNGNKTSLKKYGVKHFTNRNKCKQTKKKKYNNEYYTNRNKCFNTIKSKYNVDNPSQIIGISDKVKQTKKNRYNNENYNNQEKLRKTCLQKYGYTNPGCIKNIYYYDNISFDSSWELYFYIYCKDHNINIERNNDKFIYYINNIKHFYYPDFKIDNKYIEIKGDQFFKKDGTMQNPFGHKQDKLYEVKHQCGLKNNVIFLKEKDMKKYIDYVNIKYGKDYIKQFKKVNFKLNF